MAETNIHEEDNVVGNQSQAKVVKNEIKGDINDSTVIAAGRDVYINIERELFLPDPKQVLAHRKALTNKDEYRRWSDEFFINEAGKILPLLASPYDDDTGSNSEDLLKLIHSYERLLVLGEPGMGKTVAMQRMIWETAQASDPVVPLFIPLVYFQGELLEEVRVALNETGILQFDRIKTVRAFLFQTRCLIIFDGLNEVAGPQRERAVDNIAHFLREFPRHRYIITSRSQDELWKKLREGGAVKDAVVIQRVTDQQVRDYLISHLGDLNGEDLYKQLDERLRGLSRTPLLLWLIKETGRAGEKIPGNRGELFDRFVERVLARDEKLKPILPRWVKKRALAGLALQLHQARQLACEREQAVEMIAASERKHPAEMILNEALNHGLLQGGRQIRFLHQSMQEYFVGLALRKVAQGERQASQWQKLRQRFQSDHLSAWAQDEWWAESFVQMAGLTDDASWLARELLSVQPWLAFWCSLEGKPIDNEIRSMIEKRTITLLHSRDTKQRLRAVRQLEQFESPRTIAHLIEVLGDEDERVTNIAKQVLVRLGEPAIEPLLNTLVGPEWVRWAATQVLGRVWQLPLSSS
jgi:predicted NACHT family NTPase